MENPTFMKPKSIQITYPAPYVQSWNADHSPVILTKNSHGRNATNAKQITPASQSWNAVHSPLPKKNHGKSSKAAKQIAPTSQSWNTVQPPVLAKNNFGRCPKLSKQMAPSSKSWNAVHQSVPPKDSFGRCPKSSNFFNCPKKTAEPPRNWGHSYSAVRGPDPTAPHLKYGVFPKRRLSSSRPQPRNYPVKSTYNPHAHSLQVRQNSQEFSNIKINYLNNKKPLRKSQLVDAPMFVFRTIDKRYTRQLSLSEIMHVDIKPRRSITMSPTYCPSPPFRVHSPMLTSSPNCRSPR